jgi:hypothetical protein
MTIFDSVLVDTSTLVRLGHLGNPRLPLPPDDPAWDFLRHGGVEALALFDHVLVDGASLDRCFAQAAFWLDAFDDHDLRILNTSPDEPRLYERAVQLFHQVDWSGDLAAQLVDRGGLAFPESAHPSHVAAYEMGWDSLSVPSFDEVFTHLWDGTSEKNATTFLRPFRTLAERFGSTWELRIDERRLIPLMTNVIRLFYYLALQEQTRGLLLIHPDKDLGLTGTPEFGSAISIMQAFDTQVREAYDERRRKWLGRAITEIEAPALGRLATVESFRRGWSLGRTVAWLRQQPEVRAFRSGIRELDALLDSDDHLAVDAVLAELQNAADACSRRLDAPVRPRGRFSLQASIPLLQPAVDIPVPLPARSPAQKMLGLMTWASRS